MDLVHWLSSPVTVFYEGNRFSLAFGIAWGVFLLLIPFILPFLNSTGIKLKLMISVSWLIPWLALILYWTYSGPNKGVGNVLFEGLSTLVVCGLFSTILFLLRSRLKRLYPYGFVLASALVVSVSSVTPFIGN